ncbi:hypothetical protein ACQPZQ_39640 [Pseudonocardia sp. CA-142604]|uniref:hypothetical protein n=1 Tax=Pseudonocardia sp. CA-142604 TaxID=3240024 RepID=UPI003D8F8AA5
MSSPAQAANMPQRLGNVTRAGSTACPRAVQLPTARTAIDGVFAPTTGESPDGLTAA